MTTPRNIQISPSLAGARRAEISAVITRADGTIEDLGVIAETDFARPRVPVAAITAGCVLAAGLILHARNRGR